MGYGRGGGYAGATSLAELNDALSTDLRSFAGAVNADGGVFTVSGGHLNVTGGNVICTGNIKGTKLRATAAATGLAGELALGYSNEAADATTPTHINLPTGGTAAQAGWLVAYYDNTKIWIPYWS